MKTDKTSNTQLQSLTPGGKTHSCSWVPSKTPVLRPTWAVIDRGAFKRNFKKIKSRLKPGTKLIAVVKANAYGHVAQALSHTAFELGAWALGVSSIEEGIALRESGVRGRILILGSVFPLENLSTAAEHGLVPTISSLVGLSALSRLALRLKTRLAFHLKIDTGMGRIGVSPSTAPALFERIAAKKEIHMEGLYTHLACADFDEKFTSSQMEKFACTVKAAKALGLKFIAHAANSAATLRHREFQLDAVRPGVALYGLKPFKASEKILKLEPVMSLVSRIVFLKRVPAGTPVSYGAAFTAKKRSVIATVPIGYADGYSRLLSGKGEALVRGVRCPVAGRVTMDMLMLDVSKVPGVSIGDEAVFIGRQGRERITAEEIADKTGTINYEVTCSVSSRVPRVIIN